MAYSEMVIEPDLRGFVFPALRAAPRPGAVLMSSSAQVANCKDKKANRRGAARCAYHDTQVCILSHYNQLLVVNQSIRNNRRCGKLSTLLAHCKGRRGCHTLFHLRDH